jgi:hypothetical protein
MGQVAERAFQAALLQITSAAEALASRPEVRPVAFWQMAKQPTAARRSMPSRHLYS